MPKIPISELKKDIAIKTRLHGMDLNFHATWGLFSPEQIDEGTEMLVNAVNPKETDLILDLGCGYGAIGVTLAKLVPQGSVDMIDKDFVAVEYAKKNATLNNVSNTQSYLSNGFDQVPQEKKFDLIISNLPAKISKEYFWILLAEAHEHLKVGGELYVVTIAGLRRFIEKNFNLIFGNYELLDSKKTYFVAKTKKQ
ncbi:MAG: methyltransferase [Candidatus Taylorbacteria bacterium RIFCSPHIGHO2_01_FULL_46_22b]|uniref:Methyltransferase n=1 Tax=Candidatus Taylorbacteria bacterium RIFCSPHIGHO2_01_FULL_46_22b TaxID=1802301 RepID=A0A1G2M661_9BACT|nr:MAG: methyltransferase [Candidatus Taylorbacteria bacterium RIFCSPHIGHO2_01_FULL_46_22b]